jgi:hypothetical protein
MARHLIPSNATIKAIKPGDVRNRLADGAGLHLKLFVNGGSHGWRFDYSLNGRRNTLSLGTYPDTGLSLARKKAEEARKLVSAGIDPTNVRKEARGEAALQRVTAQRAAAGLPPLDSFEAVAREWHTKNIPNWAASHSTKIIRRLELDVFPWIGSKPVHSIRPLELLSLLKRVEDRGAVETTHRVQQNCGTVRLQFAPGRAAQQAHEGIEVGTEDGESVSGRHQRSNGPRVVWRPGLGRRAVDESGDVRALRHVSRARAAGKQDRVGDRQSQSDLDDLGAAVAVGRPAVARIGRCVVEHRRHCMSQ